MQWKVGYEVPSFVPTNTAAVQLLVDLLDGVADVPSHIAVSEAVAVQIWRLIFEKDVKVNALSHVSYRASHEAGLGTCFMRTTRALFSPKHSFWSPILIPPHRLVSGDAACHLAEPFPSKHTLL